VEVEEGPRNAGDEVKPAQADEKLCQLEHSPRWYQCLSPDLQVGLVLIARLTVDCQLMHSHDSTGNTKSLSRTHTIDCTRFFVTASFCGVYFDCDVVRGSPEVAGRRELAVQDGG
jgi:hypothetical protein